MTPESPTSALGRGLAATAACIVALALSACATSPTGRNQLIIMPASQMDAMGVQAFNQIRAEQKVEADPAINRYVQCIADAITREVTDYDAEWEVVVFQDETPNAFALPGGKMGVHTGMLKVAANQDQLAAVMGHEVGHVLAQHSNERVSQQQVANIGLTVAGQAGQLSQATMTALGIGAQYGVLLPFSRTQESEADIIGLDLMSRAGFDPRESVELWRNMASQGGGKPPEFLSTHPADSTRIANLRSKMDPAMAKYRQAAAQGKKPACKR
ncbi:MAG: M48 family metallopeptidase [Gammaproteobacteria bacterium]|nr:M48 family metallopeptidase [Gammaproteobacteria bacterium]